MLMLLSFSDRRQGTLNSNYKRFFAPSKCAQMHTGVRFFDVRNQVKKRGKNKMKKNNMY
jgi:hypothetical protein